MKRIRLLSKLSSRTCFAWHRNHRLRHRLHLRFIEGEKNSGRRSRQKTKRSRSTHGSGNFIDDSLGACIRTCARTGARPCRRSGMKCRRPTPQATSRGWRYCSPSAISRRIKWRNQTVAQLHAVRAELERALRALEKSLREAEREDAWDFARVGPTSALRNAGGAPTKIGPRRADTTSRSAYPNNRGMGRRPERESQSADGEFRQPSNLGLIPRRRADWQSRRADTNGAERCAPPNISPAL